MKIIINTSLMIPIYEQIVDQIKTLIRSGQLKENDNLPSVRTLSKELKISVLTVTRAYTELEQEGYVRNIQGRGCFVLGKDSQLLREQLVRKAEGSLTDAVKAAAAAGISREELHRLLDIIFEEESSDD